MSLEISEAIQEFLRRGRIARMATRRKDGAPTIVPICYAFDGNNLYTPLDEKPKTVPYERLARVQNILADPRVCVLVDRYGEDWSSLAYVQVHGAAHLAKDGEEWRQALELLEEKYCQYKQMGIARKAVPVIMIVPLRVYSWGVDTGSSETEVGLDMDSPHC